MTYFYLLIMKAFCTLMIYLLGVFKIFMHNKLIDVRSLTTYTVMRSHTYYFDIIFSH